jgi:cellulose synthase/poly-beta-1,6-N-acetylglucosamine synthase-like glycosyltransferase
MLLYSLLVTAAWLLLTIYLLVNSRRVALLRQLPLPASPLPPVVIIVAVRNEERDVFAALGRLCQLQYPHYRILSWPSMTGPPTAHLLYCSNWQRSMRSWSC